MQTVEHMAIAFGQELLHHDLLQTDNMNFNNHAFFLFRYAAVLIKVFVDYQGNIVPSSVSFCVNKMS